MEFLKAFYNDLKDLFATHPAVDKFHVTSNGAAFFQDNHATNHANTLPDKTVTIVTRADVENFDPANPTAPAADATVTSAQAPNTEARKQYVITADDLKNNPGVENHGVKVGDMVDMPASWTIVPFRDEEDEEPTSAADAPETTDEPAPAADAPAPTEEPAPAASAPETTDEPAPAADAPADVQTPEEVALEQTIETEEAQLEADKTTLANKKKTVNPATTNE